MIVTTNCSTGWWPSDFWTSHQPYQVGVTFLIYVRSRLLSGKLTAGSPKNHPVVKENHPNHPPPWLWVPYQFGIGRGILGVCISCNWNPCQTWWAKNTMYFLFFQWTRIHPLSLTVRPRKMVLGRRPGFLLSYIGKVVTFPGAFAVKNEGGSLVFTRR